MAAPAQVRVALMSVIFIDFLSIKKFFSLNISVNFDLYFFCTGGADWCWRFYIPTRS